VRELSHQPIVGTIFLGDQIFSPKMYGTADGSEIRPAPVEVGSLSHYLQGFIHPRWLADFLPSTVSL